MIENIFGPEMMIPGISSSTITIGPIISINTADNSQMLVHNSSENAGSLVIRPTQSDIWETNMLQVLRDRSNLWEELANI